MSSPLDELTIQKLRLLLRDKSLTYSQIARDCGVHPKTVANWAIKLGMRRQADKTVFSDEMLSFIDWAITDGWPLTEIARSLDLNPRVMWHAFKGQGLDKADSAYLARLNSPMTKAARNRGAYWSRVRQGNSRTSENGMPVQPLAPASTPELPVVRKASAIVGLREQRHARYFVDSVLAYSVG